jgi:diadenosine tetraphosphate (Ap4A) HIT family hydrolase
MPISQNPDLILETKYWRFELAYKQSYLGKSIISLNRKISHLSELTSDEFIDLQKIIQKLEKSTKKTFGATMFNWTCLMNGGYRQKPYKPFLHWHFRPRYDQKIEFEGMIFEDKDFGYHYNKFDQEKQLPEIDFSPDFRQKIVKSIQENL